MLDIEGMFCDDCVIKITKTVRSLDGVKNAQVITLNPSVTRQIVRCCLLCMTL